MNTKILLVTGAAIILALALLWPTNTPPPEISPAENAPDTASDPAEAPLPSSDALTPEQQALLDNPKVKAYAQRLEFEDDLHEFFANAPALPEQERRAQADALRNRMNEYEGSVQMSAPEAALIQLAMIQILEPDEEAAKAAAQQLMDRYRAESGARLQAWLDEPRPDFERYKAREKAIVEEVMAMDDIPGGLTRDQYLRERLQEARVEAMGRSAGNNQSN
ncbi:hypothetical protein [Marinobacter sp. bablab_jr008]|uniref:hypothetical protein n=1 Tax=Marinobacter sp. bablab_jr008 TaxID=2755064 RepID=UPI0018F216C2|nr:hypothetical protein [Marinobacter sp. bablab_jr008]MEC9387782.1 hypothetical protein [Pseudomonadota bacterium]